MKIGFLFTLCVCFASIFAEGNADANPTIKVLELLRGLTSKIKQEGEAEAKAYKKFTEWCSDAAANKKFEIRTATAEQEKLEANIAKAKSSAEVAASKIEELAADLSTSSVQLENATAIRAKESASFRSSEAELRDAIDTLGRAVAVLQREMAKNPTAFAQAVVAKSAVGSTLLQSLAAVVDAAAFPTAERQKLVGLVQARQQGGDEDDDEPGAPAAAAYQGHSGNIVDVLEDLKEKAEEELAELRKAESNAKHNFEMLRQSLEDQSSVDKKEFTEQKESKAIAEETKAASEGDLAMTVKSLEDSKAALKVATESCTQAAENHEATVKAREDELEALAEAQKVLEATTGNATSYSYSFLQESSLQASVAHIHSHVNSRVKSRMDLANYEVVDLVKRLARQQHSAVLAQLASRISAVLQFGAASSEDPFTKVKSMINDLIRRLEQESSSEATEKSYCDEEMAKTDSKKAELQGELAALAAKIDRAASDSASLQEDVRELQGALATLGKEDADMIQMRSEEHAAYVQAKSDLEAGIAGVRQALGILRDYYASAEESAFVQQAGSASDLVTMMRQPAIPESHQKATGAGSSIIGLLEVVESDFAQGLAKEEAQEEEAAASYEKQSQANKISRAQKEQDVKYKTAESKKLDKAVSELSSDKTTTDTELSAVLEYAAKLRERCIAKPETYEQRKQRREAEISGLKEALSILEGEAALVQHHKRGRHRRGFLTKARDVM